MSNLLPPSYKEKLHKQQLLRLFLLFEVIALLCVVCFLLILFAFQLFLQMRMNVLEREFSQEQVVLELLDKEEIQAATGALNRDARTLGMFYEHQDHISDTIQSLGETLSPGMYVTHMTWENDASQISLAGYAPNRDTLFAFKERLEQESDFSEIFFPPSNWIDPVDINFQVRFLIQP